MLSIVKSIGLQGLNGYFVNIEVDISNGMPCFEIVGLPDASIKESKERVRTAIKNSGFETLSRRIIINLAPANIRKEGSNLDLPIAIGVLIASGKVDNNVLNKFLEDLKAKKVEELQADLVAAKKELFNLRFQNATNQLDNTSRIKEVRRNIARIQTVITEMAKASN